MNILVCIKQVPDTTEIRIDPETNTLIRTGVPSIMNPFDAYAVEQALQLKEMTDGRVTVVTMGPPQAKSILGDALAMGVDDAYLVTDRKFGGSDTLATSYILASVARKLGPFDVILCGKQAIDGDTAQVGPQLSEHLGIPVISYTQELKVEGDSVIVKRQYDDRYHMLKAKMPCLLTALAELNEPRYMTPGGIFEACAKEITVWGRKDLKDVEDSNLGLKGSPTQIAKASDKVRKGKGETVNLDVAESVDYIMNKLQEKHII